MLSPCFVMQYFMTFVALQSKRADCFTFLFRLISFSCYSCLHHPHDAIGWCECGISRLHVYSLTLYDQNKRALGP